MASDPRFDPNYPAVEREKSQRNWLMTCLIGCLVLVVFALLVGGIIAYWVTQNWRNWAALAGSEVVMQGVNASDLPDQEKLEIELQVDRVADALGKNQLEFITVFEKLAESPLLTTIIVSTADKKFINPSGLSDEEKTEGRRTLGRFVRGNADEMIPKDATDAALAHIGTRQPDGSWRLRNKVTDDQLREFLKSAKQAADDADIPEVPPPFDPSDEVKRVIDEAMATAPEREP